MKEDKWKLLGLVRTFPCGVYDAELTQWFLDKDGAIEFDLEMVLDSDRLSALFVAFAKRRGYLLPPREDYYGRFLSGFEWDGVLTLCVQSEWFGRPRYRFFSCAYDFDRAEQDRAYVQHMAGWVYDDAIDSHAYRCGGWHKEYQNQAEQFGVPVEKWVDLIAEFLLDVMQALPDEISDRLDYERFCSAMESQQVDWIHPIDRINRWR